MQLFSLRMHPLDLERRRGRADTFRDCSRGSHASGELACTRDGSEFRRGSVVLTHYGPEYAAERTRRCHMTSIDLTLIDPYSLDDDGSEAGPDWHKRRRKLALDGASHKRLPATPQAAPTEAAANCRFWRVRAEAKTASARGRGESAADDRAWSNAQPQTPPVACRRRATRGRRYDVLDAAARVARLRTALRRTRRRNAP